ncbi:MAG: outer membrane lipoprotein-sorting protein [Thermodesulfobacteriota bacterium]
MKRLWLVVLLVLLPVHVHALTAVELMEQSQAAFLYPGQDFRVRIHMRLIAPGGQERVREMVMLRRNEGPPGGDQKYFIAFQRPADVKDMTLMVHKYPAQDDDRWLFVPAINMVRRIAAQDKRSSFVGSDFTYEDVSGRDVASDTHTLLGEEKVGEADCHKVKSTPNAGDVDYADRISWIDKRTFLPLKEEYYDLKGAVIRVFAAERVEVVAGIPTVVRRSMRNLQTGHRTEVEFSQVAYGIGIEDSLFSERFLRQPPRKWLD